MKQSTLHVAVIMDGNGRWANRRGLPRLAGHRAGAEALRRVVEAAADLGAGMLTAYAFSSDNWKRPAEEVDGLMALLAWNLGEETPRLLASGVRLSVIGRRDRLPEVLLEAIRGAERTTAGGARLHLRLAIDYSARDAIVRATQLAAGLPPEARTEMLSAGGPGCVPGISPSGRRTGAGRGACRRPRPRRAA